jgi:hypothetical protein
MPTFSFRPRDGGPRWSALPANGSSPSAFGSSRRKNTGITFIGSGAKKAMFSTTVHVAALCCYVECQPKGIA